MVRTRDRDDGTEDASAPLDERVVSLMTDFPGAITFAGLRRTLGIHPESLSRSLRRLERDGRLVRTEGGYRLAGASPAPGAVPPVHGWFPREGDRLAVEVRLASEESAERVLGSLAGRWFGNYRWVGSYEGEERTTLVWTSSGHAGSLALVVEGSLLRVYSRSSRTEDEGTAAAYELLQHAMTALRAPRARPTMPVLHLAADETPRPRFDLAG